MPRKPFACGPTGSGKSLCYAILPAAFDALKSTAKESMRTQSIVIVVSPLVALMEDQVASFYSKGIRF